ncbi:hypothetical protein GGU11DRAFT_576834 [Lentinula aff. detonsa]|uniref:Pali-domain-containing protein n=1 Tax=Lentinula aff. detonsa TaxID=2804958 RepID=A0AA38U1P2_9AGAR|nr:hypothetical protein GGU10DRAFT_2330 [Lentinula aff. detonsa]KAJ3802471.1 hypothetical protein GGU11DRAFT_576834 [Lentinula aff. detonsa]
MLKFLLFSLLCTIICLCGTHAAYISIHDQKQSWAGLQEGLMVTPALDELDTQYLCDVMIANDAFQISVHATSSDNWLTTYLDGTELPKEYIAVIDQHLRTNLGQTTSPTSTSDHDHSYSLSSSSSPGTSSSISCKRLDISGSALRQRIGFMHIIDLLSIIGVGFLAATASGIAALLRRHDHQRPSTEIPRFLQLNHLHERPHSDETDYAFDYIKSKLG